MAGAGAFFWSGSDSYSTGNILFLRDPKYEYLSMTMTSVVEPDLAGARAGVGEEGSGSGLLLFGLGLRGTVVAK